MSNKKDKVREIEKLLPCINRDCDNDGICVVADDQGDACQEQCQFCFEVRFPVFEKFKQTRQDILDEVEGFVRDNSDGSNIWEPAKNNTVDILKFLKSKTP